MFVPHTYGVNCQQTVPCAKHIENVAQQSDVFAAINVACEQTISYAKHTENFTQQSDLVDAVMAVVSVGEQMILYAEHMIFFPIQIFCCTFSCILKAFWSFVSEYVRIVAVVSKKGAMPTAHSRTKIRQKIEKMKIKNKICKNKIKIR